ncbi:MAG: UDP-3-O-(3-hydroxymyristoyl)glucosamine N-acyltransferase [Candidatus Sericytochromatia bacterium]|nr:UDP-3-O-(3-hydroxymyristoyl)glucosamine N-acyltransferase [Candidatus Tanganyikabacteria bacterium]
MKQALAAGPATGVSLARLAEVVGGTAVGDPEAVVVGVAEPEQAGPGDLVFLLVDRHAARVRASAAGFVLAATLPEGRVGVAVARPREAMARVMALFAPPLPPPGIHPTAFVDPSATLGEAVSIGPFGVVGADVRIGRGTVLHARVVLYDGVEVGEDAVLHAGAVVREGCVLGDRVCLQPGAVVGSDGFGVVPTAEGNVRTPQLGRVVLEADVEIGANSTVDRATLGETRIGRGTKLDNLVHVAHNVRIGRDGMIVAQAGVAGSATLGDRVVMGGQTGIVGHVRIGDGVVLAARGVLTKDTAAPGLHSGFPARPHREELRRQALPQQLSRRLDQLEERLRSPGSVE